MILVSISSRGSAFSITFSTIYRSAWIRFKWNLTFLSTFCTDCIVHFSRSTIWHLACTSILLWELALFDGLTLNEITSKVLYKLVRMIIFIELLIKISIGFFSFLNQSSVMIWILFPHFLHLRLRFVIEPSLNGVKRLHFGHFANFSLPWSFLWIVSTNAEKILYSCWLLNVKILTSHSTLDCQNLGFAVDLTSLCSFQCIDYL